MALRLRPLTADEHHTLERLLLSPTAAARVVTRARILWYAQHGYRVPVIATRLQLTPGTVRTWLHRFHTQGLAGLQDRPRGRRPMGSPGEPAPASGAPSNLASRLALEGRRGKKRSGGGPRGGGRQEERVPQRGERPWGVATFNLKTPERGHHTLFLP
jgi:hypothetical protein